MTNPRSLLWAGGLMVLVLGTACGQAGGGPGGGGPGPGTYADDDVVIRVEYLGGFLPYDALLTRLPLVSVYGDGRVITEGPVIAIYPGPALPNVQVQKISTADVGRLVELALSAGVGDGRDLGDPPVADAPSTRFTVLTDSGEKVTDVLALGEAGGGQTGLTEAQRAGRVRLQGLLAALTDLPTTLGAGAVGESRSYAPTALAAIVRPWTDTSSDDIPTPPEMAWPGPELPGPQRSRGLDVSCVTVAGDQVAAVLATAESANTLTPWVHGGKRWTIRFRPLLPDETSCDDLFG